MIKAVITGDIEKSTRLNESNRSILIKEMEIALQKWNKDFSMTSELYRGDSLQCLLQNPADALRVTLILKTFIKSLNPSTMIDMYGRNTNEYKGGVIKTIWMYDIRLSIGIGEVESNYSKLVTANGDAFIKSGRALDELANKKLSINIATDDDYEQELKTEFVLLDAILSTVTALQSEVITNKLLGYNEKEIAKRLNIGQSAVNQRSNSGKWNAIETIVNRFEKIYS